MKKVLSVLLVMTLMLSLAACGGGEATSGETTTAAGDATTVAGDATTAEGETTTAEGETTEDASANEDRVLVVGSSEFTGDFHEGFGNASYDKRIRELVSGPGLMVGNEKGEVVDSPIVASKTVSDDLMEWSFVIADDAVFHNDEALTASDVKFTYDFYLDKKSLEDVGGSSAYPEYIDEVIVDEATNTATFKLKKVIYTVDATLFVDLPILPEETTKSGAESEGITVHEYIKQHISEPVGYGPYVLDEYAESEYVKLSAFDKVLGRQPKIKNIIVKVVPSETELDQLLQGEIDMITGQTESEKIDAAADTDFLTMNNYYRHGGGTIILHTDFGPTQITEVRQAFAYVFNRPKVIELFLGEYGISSQGPYSKNDWMMYDDDEANLVGKGDVGKFEASLIDYDILDADGNFDEAANIAKAHELLDQAAAKTDGAYAKLTGDAATGYLWEGEPLTIALTYTEFWSDTYNLVWPQDYIDKLGFNITLTGLDWPVMYGHWIGETEEQRQYNGFVGGISYTLKANPRADYSVDKIMPWGNPSANGARFSGGSKYTPEEWEKLLIDIENVNPVDGRDQYRELWREFVKTFNEQMPVVPVYSNNYHDIYNAELENFNTNALWEWSFAVVDAHWK